MNATRTTHADMTAAIDRSQSHTEIVSVDFAGNRKDLLYEIGRIVDDVLDYTHDNDGRIDVWGWDGGTPEGEQKWRLCVTLV